MCVQVENPLFFRIAYCVEAGKTDAIPLRNPRGESCCQTGNTLGSLDISGRSLRIQQGRQACRPGRGVSRSNVEKTKQPIREVTRRAAKNTEGKSGFLCMTAGSFEDKRFAPSNRCSDRRQRALVFRGLVGPSIGFEMLGRLVVPYCMRCVSAPGGASSRGRVCWGGLFRSARERA